MSKVGGSPDFFLPGPHPVNLLFFWSVGSVETASLPMYILPGACKSGLFLISLQVLLLSLVKLRQSAKGPTAGFHEAQDEEPPYSS